MNHRHAPLIGQDNEEVITGILGMSREELVSGYSDGTFWPDSMDLYPYQKELLQ